MKSSTGTSTAHSRGVRSESRRFSSWVISPKMTRWYIHSMYTAARMMPVVARTATGRFTWNAPSRMRNSPTKPFSPGSPSDERDTTRKSAENAGMTVQSPPKSAMSRVWRRS